MTKKKILVVGATGMLGNAQMTELSKYKNFDVFGTVRYFEEAKKYLPAKLLNKIYPNVDVENIDSLIKVFNLVKPDLVINCVGLIKQSPSASNMALAIYMNALLPHRLASLSEAFGARLIHISTDCIFSGSKGNYKESDPSDAGDVYGRTKFLGEVEGPHCFTMRTSIIGHGLESHVSLIDWFLTQKGKIKGYTKVIYSGFPTVEIARIIAEYIIPNENLSGVYHVSSEPISKYDLLKIVAKIYHKKIEISLDDKFILDRSLDSTKFCKAASYQPPSWEQLVKKMYQNYKNNKNFIQF